MDPGHQQTQRESLLQRLLHCDWCHHRLDWRDQIQAHRLYVSTGGNLLRSDPLGNGGKAPKFCRVQDGPLSFLVLLRPCLRHHELLRLCCF